MLNSLHDEADHKEEIVEKSYAVVMAERQTFVDVVIETGDLALALKSLGVAIAHGAGPVLRESFTARAEMSRGRAKR